jgi:hypothetical protein
MPSVQHYFEELQEIFGKGETQILAELDRSQKRLEDEVRYLITAGQLNSPSTNTGWSLPAGFRALIDILFYDSSGNPLYIDNFAYDYEIVGSKLYIFAKGSTPITGLDSSIDTAYILYEYDPSTISALTDTFDLPVQMHDGILAGAYQKLYMKYPIKQIVNGNLIEAISPSMAGMWENEFRKYKRKYLIFKNTQDSTHKEAIHYPHAGKFELPRRIKDIGSATVIYPISSLYDKYARWTLVYPSTVTSIVAPVGYAGTLTASITSNQLTITSTESDFGDTADYNANQEDILVNSFSTTTWVFDLPIGSWGTIRFEIFE